MTREDKLNSLKEIGQVIIIYAIIVIIALLLKSLNVLPLQMGENLTIARAAWLLLFYLLIFQGGTIINLITGTRRRCRRFSE